MSELIKINDEGLVSAKELYLGLGLNKSNWSRWYPTNIQNNEFFEENKDWVGVRHEEEGNETMDFAITLEFAKHISMMARTPKSHDYRNYFISCEKKLKDINTQNILSGEVLKTITDNIKSEIGHMIDERLAEVNREISEKTDKQFKQADKRLEKAQEYYKIKAKTKYDLILYIKNRLGISRADGEYEEVKARVFLILRINKWEDLELDRIEEILPVIDESIKVIKAERPQQLSMWE